MRDLLVRYLLGELDSEKRELLEEQLLQSPELRRELEYLRSCLPSTEKPESHFSGPPLGLAERTVDRVSDVASGAPPFDEAASARALSERAALASYAVEPPLGGLPSWSLADLTVAGGVFLAISMLFLPALRQSRDMARRNDCANNLGQLGVILAKYSDDHFGDFPLVGPTDKAGIFSVRLVSEGYANADDLARLLVCRSSPLANEIASGRVVIQFPTAAQLAAASPAVMELCRRSGGSYAYAIGYYQGGIYHGLRNDRSPYSPVMADAPNNRLVDMQSPNHRGCGQNVLTADGAVHYQRTCTRAGQQDNIYLNEEGQPHAAHVKTDVVLIRSEATPGLVSTDR